MKGLQDNMSILRRIKRILFRKNTLSEFVNRGGVIGNNVKVFDTRFDMLFPWLITIGNNVTLTGVQVLAHDASTKIPLGYTKIGKVIIGDNVFVGRGTIILPNVTIGNNVVIGVGSVVTNDIPDNSIAVGNPCQVIKKYDDYVLIQKHNLEESSVVIKKSPKELSRDEIEQIRNELDGIGYIV